MIYLVTASNELVNNDVYVIITVELSLSILDQWNTVQFDTETTGTDAHIDRILTMQFGNHDKSIQIVVDCTTVNPLRYKRILETKFLIGQNLKFDLQFCYTIGIIPKRLYDIMIAEQLRYLGYPSGSITYNLQDIAERYLGIYIDKTIRGQINYLGLKTEVIKYGAGDVTHLHDIMEAQLIKIKEQGLMQALILECDFVRVIAYLEWCGIHLDQDKWKAKMRKDRQNLYNASKALNDFVVNTPSLSKYVTRDLQGDLFNGFNTEPIVSINWASSKQVVEVTKILGFDVKVKDKKTGEDKESVLEKHLKTQKGINDEFLNLYFKYQEYFKVTTSFGQGHLNAINPITGRIHTVYKQLGAASGRMSCGSQQPNTSLAKLKGLRPKDCCYPNIQQLPHDAETRACFTATQGHKVIDCDWSAAEARLAGDIYQDKAIIDMFLKGLDSHSVYAKAFFPDELKDVAVEDVKRQRPDLRQLAKGPEFALNFGGGFPAIMSSIGCTKEEAMQIVSNYEKTFVGTAQFAKRGSELVRQNGYVLMNQITGHKMYWYDHAKWKAKQDSFTPAFWEDYRENHKGTNDYVCQDVSQHFKAAGKWDRMARNAPTQGTCAVMLKKSQITLFDWVIDNGYFGIILLCALIHDECYWETPEEMASWFARKIEKVMLDTAAIYCKSLPIPAEAEVGDCWIH